MQLSEIEIQGFFRRMDASTLTSELDKIKQTPCYIDILKFSQHSINTEILNLYFSLE